jgi:hypothetical protein
VPNSDSPTWAKYIEVYKRDEGKRRQISGPRNFVSDAKMYRYTKGSGNRGRQNYGNYRGTYGNNNNYRTENRDMVSREEMEENVHKAGQMERFIQIAGEHARDRRQYDPGFGVYDDIRSNASFDGKISVRSRKSESSGAANPEDKPEGKQEIQQSLRKEKDQPDSLEFDSDDKDTMDTTKKE